MYVDNELTSEQRAEVELFVQQNLDLQKEFEMLQQTKLTTDEEILFAHKTDLLKIKDSIGIDNYEEFFLLYIDNELNESGKEAVEKFVLQHPQLQDEFTLLKQTVLPQEKITFSNKKSLYRKEDRRVIPYWARIAAAAAFIGITAMVWWIVPNNSINNNDITIATEKLKKQTVKPDQNVKQDTTVQPLIQTPADSNKELAETRQTENKKNNKSAIANPEKKIGVKPAEKSIQEENKDFALNKRKNKKAPNQEPKDTISADRDKPVVKNEPLIADINTENDNPGKDPLEQAKSINAINTPNLNTLVQPAVYKELNTNDDDNLQSSLYIGNMELNKNKVRGIMKKVGGLFAGKSKKSSDEKGKLQVAGFELNTN
jgi:hypothetical protein